MAASSFPSQKLDNNDTAPSTIWNLLGAPVAGNVSFLAGFLHWLAIAFKWFLNLILLLLAAGVVLGTGALIFGSLKAQSIRHSGKSKATVEEDAPLGGELIELDLMAANYELEDGFTSESDDDL